MQFTSTSVISFCSHVFFAIKFAHARTVRTRLYFFLAAPPPVFPVKPRREPGDEAISIPELINRVESESICYFCSDFCYGLHYVMPIWFQVLVLITPTLAQGRTRPGTLSPRGSHSPRDTLTQRLTLAQGHSHPGAHTCPGTLSHRDTLTQEHTLAQEHSHQGTHTRSATLSPRDTSSHPRIYTRPGTLSPRDTHSPKDTLTQGYTFAQGHSHPETLSPRNALLPRDTLTQRHSHPETHTHPGTHSVNPLNK